jgi:ParB family chromosome partitioning protein
MANGKQKAGLGRGFDSLLPTSFDSSILVDSSERVHKLAVDVVKPNPDQPRKVFEEEALRELAESIKQYGIVQPLVVTQNGDTYVIIAGERRWRAAKAAKLKHVPAVIRTAEDLEQLEVALIENVQRVDLSSLEQALSIERLHQHFNSSYEDIARRLGKGHSTVVNIVRLLKLPEEAKQSLAAQDISEGHARQILALAKHPEKQAELLDLIKKHGWSVRQAERYVLSHKEGVAETEKMRERVETETPETKALGKRLGTKVAVKRMAKGGRLEITFKDDAHLENLLNSLK